MADRIIQMQVRNEANTAWDNIYPVTKDNVPYAIATGSTNVYAATITPAPSSYVEGMAVAVKIPVDSTSASTINVNGLGAKGIKKANGADVTNLKAGGIYTLRYDGVNFILQGEGASGNATASDLLLGKTATTDAGEITGTIPTKSAATITPGTIDQVIAAGQYLSGAQTIKGDVNLTPANILSGKSIFGVAGDVSPGRKYASGSVSISSSEISFTLLDGTTKNSPYVTVSGLTFTPSIIRLYSTATIMGVTGYYTTQFLIEGILIKTGEGTYTDVKIITGSSHEALFSFYQLISPAYVNSTGFCLPCSGLATSPATWKAWE